MYIFNSCIVWNYSTMLLSAIFGILFLGIMWTRRKLYWVSWQLPGPLALPILGNVLDVVDMKTTEDIFKRAIQYMKKYGPTFRFWMGPRLTIVVSTPEDLDVVYNNPVCFEKDLMILKGMRSALGDGLITSPVSVWKPHRKLINPTFNQKILNNFVDTFVDNANIMAENIKKHAGKDEFDIYPYIFGTTVRFICESALGLNFSTLKHVEDTLTQYLDQTMEICFQRMVKIWLYPDVIFYSSTTGKIFERNMKYLDTITDRVIKEKRQEFKENTNKQQNNVKAADKLDYEFVSQKKNFIELLIEQNENGKGFTDEELRDQINTFISGGSDTSAIEVSFACMLLGAHPVYQDAAYEEIKEIFGESDRRITVEDLSKMKYIERVLKETLRLFPPLPILVRYLKNDVKFSTMTAPAGSTILFSNFFTQRDPKYWPDPLKFNPDRFLPEEVSKRHPYCYVPFGGGPRNCIGYRYAMMSMKILLCTLLRKYRFQSNINTETVRIKVEIILKAVEGHPVKIVQRENYVNN